MRWAKNLFGQEIFAPPAFTLLTAYLTGFNALQSHAQSGQRPEILCNV